MATKSVVTENCDEMKEPSIESSDPKERRLARQLRIQRHSNALRKSDPSNDANAKESLTEKQILESAELLEKVIAEGYEVITTVQVANDARELERKRSEAKIQEKFLNRIEEFRDESKKRCEHINRQWAVILALNDPLAIKDAMDAQSKSCDLVIESKRKIIEELKAELDRADNVYYDDQRKQKDDIQLLIERIENQMSSVENIYSRELRKIEKTLKAEMEAVYEDYQKQWDELLEKEKEDDEAGDRKLQDIMVDYEEEMRKIMTEHDEHYRAQKIVLDKECQQLQQKVERTKAECLLNAEKLDYDYIVLKSRDEENTIIKNQQKRKINKLQSQISKLKQNYADLETSSNLEIDKLSKQILKTHRCISEIEDKSDLFTRVNEKQYFDIWNMNTQTVNELLEKILTADRIIHERVLGILWEAPKFSLPTKEDLPSYREAVKIIEARKQEEIEAYKIFHYDGPDEREKDLERKVLNNIFKQISECSEYLIEDKLQALIANRSEEEKTIIRIDNIFQALSITTTEEIGMLLNFFLPYAYCPICSVPEPSSTESSSETIFSICECEVDVKERELINSVKKEIKENPKYKEERDNSGKDFSSGITVCYSPSAEEERSGTEESEGFRSRFTCDKGHLLQIQTVHVAQAIRDIVYKYDEMERRGKRPFAERLRERKFTISRHITEEDVKTYWGKYREIFGPDKEQLWDAILIGLTKYHDILKETNEICNDIEHLEKQNAEFRRLLESQKQCELNEATTLQSKSIKSVPYQLKIKE